MPNAGGSFSRIIRYSFNVLNGSCSLCLAAVSGSMLVKMHLLCGNGIPLAYFVPLIPSFSNVTWYRVSRYEIPHSRRSEPISINLLQMLKVLLQQSLDEIEVPLPFRLIESSIHRAILHLPTCNWMHRVKHPTNHCQFILNSFGSYPHYDQFSSPNYFY